VLTKKESLPGPLAEVRAETIRCVAKGRRGDDILIPVELPKYHRVGVVDTSCRHKAAWFATTQSEARPPRSRSIAHARGPGLVRNPTPIPLF